MSLRRTHVFLVWGLFDLLYVVRFLGLSLGQGRIPIYSDLMDAGPLEQPLLLAVFWLGISLLLTVSIVGSAFLFLRRSRAARMLAFIQTPFRLLLAVPSVSCIPWLVQAVGSLSVTLNLSLLLASEVVKVLSLRAIRPA